MASEGASSFQALTDGQQMFLQVFMARRCLSEDETRELLRNVSDQLQRAPRPEYAYPSHGDPHTFRHLLRMLIRVAVEDTLTVERDVRVINDTLEPFSLAIQRTKRISDGIVYFAIVNMKRDEVSKLASSHSAAHLLYLRGVINEIGTNHAAEGCISVSDALRLGTDSKLTVREAQAALDAFREDGWISVREGNIYLSPRGYMELRPYLSDYPDLQTGYL